MGLGSFVFVLPHFLTDAYLSSVDVNGTVTSEDIALCTLDSEENEIDCQDNQDNSLSNYFYFFLVGQLLHGFGAAPITTLAVTLLDEVVGKNTAPIYIGIFMVNGNFSPILCVQSIEMVLLIYSKQIIMFCTYSLRSL